MFKQLKIFSIFILAMLLAFSCGKRNPNNPDAPITQERLNEDGYKNDSGEYQIYNKSQLNWIAENFPNDGSVIKLMNDITVDSSFQGIAIGNSPAFDGTFDGQGNTIDGLQINQNADNVGFIGKTSKNAVVKNLTIKNGDVKGKQNISMLVGNNSGTITGCAIEGGIVKSSLYQVGGIAGVNNSDGVIELCYNTATIDGNNWVGGIAGVGYGVIGNCYNTGKIISQSRGGGITSDTQGSSKIQNCYSIGNAKAGIIDRYQNNPTVSGCYYLSGNGGIGATQKAADKFILLDFGWGDTSIWKQKDFIGDTVASRPVLIEVGEEGN